MVDYTDNAKCILARCYCAFMRAALHHVRPSCRYFSKAVALRQGQRIKALLLEICAIHCRLYLAYGIALLQQVCYTRKQPSNNIIYLSTKAILPFNLITYLNLWLNPNYG